MNSREEIWKPIVGYDGYYEVSDFGRVRRLKKNNANMHIIKLYTNKRNGYVYAALSKDNRKSSLRVHKAVMEAFTDFRSNGFDAYHVIDHIDGDKTNNRLNNLEIVTQRENDRRARERGKQRVNGTKVINLDTGEIYESYTAASRAVGGKKGVMVSRVCDGKRSHYRGVRFARYDDYKELKIPIYQGKIKRKTSECLWR